MFSTTAGTVNVWQSRVARGRRVASNSVQTRLRPCSSYPRGCSNAIADLPDPITDLNNVKTVASRLRVSLGATTQHLFNITLMAEEVRDDILRKLALTRDPELDA
ncbi:MAG TPA: hypothetical protein VLJ59_10900 [Mycobacteriales bacterium]|nr:hypothetical protein [Mycobacteriales bacterium]